VAWSLPCSVTADQRFLIEAALKTAGGLQTLMQVNCKSFVRKI